MTANRKRKELLQKRVDLLATLSIAKKEKEVFLPLALKKVANKNSDIIRYFFMDYLKVNKEEFRLLSILDNELFQIIFYLSDYLYKEAKNFRDEVLRTAEGDNNISFQKDRRRETIIIPSLIPAGQIIVNLLITAPRLLKNKTSLFYEGRFTYGDDERTLFRYIQRNQDFLTEEQNDLIVPEIIEILAFPEMRRSHLREKKRIQKLIQKLKKQLNFK